MTPAESGGYDAMKRRSGLVDFITRTDGCKIDRIRRISFIVDNLDPNLFGVFSRTFKREDREFGICAHERNCFRLGIQAGREIEKSPRYFKLSIWPIRKYLKIAIIIILIVHSEGADRKEYLAASDDGRHCGCGDDSRVTRNNQVDFVNVEQFRINTRDGSRRGLIVVIDEFNLAPEQASFRVHLVGPNLIGKQRRLAAARKAAAKRHTETYLDRSC